MIAAIIQARMGSTRLPNKTMMDLMGKPMLWHFLERIKKAKSIDKVIIATSIDSKDDIIADFARREGIDLFRGSENDVLDRFYKAAKKCAVNAIVRVTPDCPLICPDILDKAVREYLKGGYDYVTNTLVYTYPEGCDVEVFSLDALKKAWHNSRGASERENVTPYIRNSGKFRLKNIENDTPVDPKDYKWSVDRNEDFNFVSEVYKNLYKKGKIFSMKEIMNLLRRKPKIQKINSGSTVNEGYYKSFLKLPPVKAKRVDILRSLKLKQQAKRLIPGCSQTFSKGPTQFVQGVSPVFLEKGKGSHVWDVDGNEFIDYAMALGPVILGHNYPKVTDAVREILKKGNSFSLPHRLEVELSRLLCEIIPCAEMARFGKNGSDATSAAVRIARAFTGKDKIICCGYHGWHDWYIATTTMNKGIPEAVKKLTFTFKYNDIKSLEDIFSRNKNQIACVIMEPVGIIEPKPGFLEEVKKITQRNKAVLIFDEVVTGFRFSLGGAQEYFKVTPDLACFGKAMANGFPIAATVGKKRLMALFEKVFCSFTFGGEIVSLAAALATIREIKAKGVIRYIWEQGRKIKDSYNVLAGELGLGKYTQCIGFAPRTVVSFKDKKGNEDALLKSFFQQECLKRGILFTAGHNVCFNHSNQDIDKTLRVYATVLKIVQSTLKKGNISKRHIEGEPVKPVFRKA